MILARLNTSEKYIDKWQSVIRCEVVLVIFRLCKTLAYSLVSNGRPHPLINFSKNFPALCPHSNLHPLPGHPFINFPCF